jgi:hypothetical protein
MQKLQRTVIDLRVVVTNATDDGIVEFRLTGSDRQPSSGGGSGRNELHVTAATVNVLLRPLASSSANRRELTVVPSSFDFENLNANECFCSHAV